MQLQEINLEYQKILNTENVADILHFTKNLLSTSDPKVIEYHFSLLKNRTNQKLFQHLRAAFAKRGLLVEDFLVKKTREATDKQLRADALQLLGNIRSPKAREIALDFISHADSNDRYRGCIVLGWVGGVSEIEPLSKILLNDPVAINRGWAATALRQLWFNNKKLSTLLLPYIKQAIFEEKDEQALSLIIISAQSILNKKFGLVEDVEEREITGDIKKAKEQALKFL